VVSILGPSTKLLVDLPKIEPAYKGASILDRPEQADGALR